jgi:hypothetical protein
MSNPGSRRRRIAIAAAALALAAPRCASTSRSGGEDGEFEGLELPPRERAEEAGGGRRARAPLDPAIAIALLAALQQGARNLSSFTGGHQGEFDRESLWSLLDDWEPALACSRDGRLVCQMTTRFADPYSTSSSPVILRVSLDGGASFLPDQYVEDLKPWEADPQVQIADDDAIYALWMHGFTPGCKIKKSADRGRTWSAPVVVAPAGGGNPPGTDKPVLLVSPDGQDVYVGFNWSHSYVAASHDGANTFATAVKTSNDSRAWYHSGGCIAPNGDVYFAAADFRATFRGTADIDLIRSTDGGLTWTTQVVDTVAEPPGCAWSPGCYFGFFGSTAVLACDDAGTFMLAYVDSTVANAPQQIVVRTSTDGVTWSAKRQISYPNAAVNNAFPGVVAGRDPGDYRIVWQDDRFGFGLWNTWFTQTRDGGATWSPHVRLSDALVSGPYKTSAGYFFPYGDYLGMAIDEFGTHHVIWGEGASWNGPGGTWYTQGR